MAAHGADGIEVDSPRGGAAAVPAGSMDAGESWPIAFGQTLLIAAELHDQTDAHNELLHERRWLLHPADRSLSLRGNAFAIENTLDGSGVVMLLLGPLPAARATPSDWDLAIRGDAVVLNCDQPYPWATAKYVGGTWGRIAACRELQRQARPYDPAADGLFLTNTWGDRARDAHLKPAFILAEIAAAAKLGADVVQIDDGWQQGVTANSSAARKGGGVWDGFWASDPNFWNVHRERFPDGLAPLVSAAKGAGVRLGLWFAPDSSADAANWRRDADAILKLHREHGINFFKIDAMKITSPASEENLRRLFSAVRAESGGRVSFDFAITAERRFGYFDLMEHGRLFVENRYTDWHNYWPHHTLRQAWQLSHWVDPVRLRMEWLNHARNDQHYADDPLAPSRYRPDALFATVMFNSPLGWFESQHLPATYLAQAGPLIATWRLHREAIHRGTIYPVGNAPDGSAYTGYVSIDPGQRVGYALIFRELSKANQWSVAVPHLTNGTARIEVLGGHGGATLVDGELHVQIPDPLCFLWLRFSL
ncbi:hypothetical protein BH10PLA1_BH10PLA1_14780 [soil metagenome]